MVLTCDRSKLKLYLSITQKNQIRLKYTELANLYLYIYIYLVKLETSLFYSPWSLVYVVATCSMYMHIKPWRSSEYDRVQFTRYARFTYRPVTGTVICTFCTCTLYVSSICWFSSCRTIHAIGAIRTIIFLFIFSLFSICHGFPKTSEIRHFRYQQTRAVHDRRRPGRPRVTTARADRCITFVNVNWQSHSLLGNTVSQGRPVATGCVVTLNQSGHAARTLFR